MYELMTQSVICGMIENIGQVLYWSNILYCII